jgi:hypothetical protein
LVTQLELTFGTACRKVSDFAKFRGRSRNDIHFKAILFSEKRKKSQGAKSGICGQWGITAIILMTKTLLMAKHIALEHDRVTEIIPGSAIAMKIFGGLTQLLQNLPLIMLVFVI